MENQVITLRCVYKIKEYHFQPGKMPNGANFPFVKPVKYDAYGNAEMIMSDAERNDPNSQYFLAEDEDIVVTEGTTFDLSDPLQYNKWMVIRNSDLIVPTRDARDDKGHFFIDGDKKRYGIAELYVDVPGASSAKSVSKMKKITEAWTYIEGDSQYGRLTKCKLLGRYMENAPDTDVQEYLYREAERTPDKIIELYTSGDMALKLLIIDAKAKMVITRKDGMFQYADNILGATEDAVLLFLKMPTNKRVLDAIKFETYPEYAPVKKIEEKIDKVEEAVEKVIEESKAVEEAPAAPNRKSKN